ncbi:MAG TPA: hypothetical protein VOA87_12365 [Thermoanaerobaculia bacterium]|nr:hypothetical protein [Thermoanaerobaculia bacterium]
MAVRSLLATWYLPLLAGVLPVLLLGFGYSAIADRLAFVYWALALAAAYTILLRQGTEAGWSGPRLGGALALLLAAGLACFAAIERAHQEILDLGFRAVLPGLYRPLTTSPGTALGGAVGLALLAAASFVAGRRRA